ncbi:MAG: MBL fold metallo-hydrolase [Patescibacteria group bacterium]|nr:MBL fold metallo-hydrolase [Patescibacteria group bacterium]
MPLQITALGHSCFEIKSDGLTVVTDPFDSKVGELPVDLKANIVSISHDHFDHNAISRVNGDPKVFDWPGEYEVAGVQIRGYQSFHDSKNGAERGENVIFVFRFPDATIAHLGDLGHELDSDIVEKMGQIDVLLVPIGGTYTLDAKGAKKVIDAIEPRIVIPMHFSEDKLNSE